MVEETTSKAQGSAADQFIAHMGPDRVERNVPLAPLTTFRIGGPADLFFEARTRDELRDAVCCARSLHLPCFVLGLGANILVADGGVRGVVIRNRATQWNVDSQRGLLYTESGGRIAPELIETAVSHGLSGLEHFAGIPSTVGGALWQNLHFLSPAPERERTLYIAEILTRAEILTAEGKRIWVKPEYFRFDYDYSVLHERDDIVLAAEFRLEQQPEQVMRRVISENLAWRAQRHPQLDSEPSAGSIFKKIRGHGAGRLIDECGLKGLRIGGACITERHANIVVNVAQASAADVLHLIQRVQSVVHEQKGLWLEPEILFVGEFSGGQGRA